MAPKRLAENPPPAASSEEEETEEEEESDSESNQENIKQNGVVDKQDDDDDDDDDDGDNEDDIDEEEEEEEEKGSHASKKSAVPATPQKSKSGTDSDDSESTQPSPSLSAFTIKPHNRSPKPNKPATKRPAESGSLGPTNKKKKPAGGDEEEVVKKTGAIQRLWSEDDELAILNGLSEYKSAKGADPYSDMDAFHAFIKKKLHVDVSTNQLKDKIRRLKKKYQNNIERGQDNTFFSKPHEEKSFQLSKNVWGNNQKYININNKSKNNNTGGSGGVTLGLVANQPSSKKPIQAPKMEEEKVQMKKIDEKVENLEDFWRKYPFLSESLDFEKGLSDGVKVTLREGFGLIDEEKLKELDNKWKKLKQDELELFVKRIELVHDQVKLALHSIKSSDI